MPTGFGRLRRPNRLKPLPDGFSMAAGLPQAALAICTSARVMGELSTASGTPLSCAARAEAYELGILQFTGRPSAFAALASSISTWRELKRLTITSILPLPSLAERYEIRRCALRNDGKVSSVTR